MSYNANKGHKDPIAIADIDAMMTPQLALADISQISLRVRVLLFQGRFKPQFRGH